MFGFSQSGFERTGMIIQYVPFGCSILLFIGVICADIKLKLRK